MADFNLRHVDALTFDVFGTTVDWFTTISREVARQSKGRIAEGSKDAEEFAKEWREGYYRGTKAVGAGGQASSLNVDVMHGDILETMLSSERWEHLGEVWPRDSEERRELIMSWHKLDPYPDTVSGLTKLKAQKFVIAFSNGNYRLLLDMAKHANLPWDGILSANFFGTYKPAPKSYASAQHHLDLPPERIAMVAAHIHDLRAASKAGFRTVYVRRAAEDVGVTDSVKPKNEGGEVDAVVGSFEELAALLRVT